MSSALEKAAKWHFSAKAYLKQYQQVRKPEKELIKEINEGLKEVTSALVTYFDEHPDKQVETEFGLMRGKAKAPKASKLDVGKSQAIFLQALSAARGARLTPEMLQSLENNIKTSISEQVPSVDEDDPMQRTAIKVIKNKKRHHEPEVELTEKNFGAKMMSFLGSRPELDFDDDEVDEVEEEDAIELAAEEAEEEKEAIEAVYEEEEPVPGADIAEAEEKARVEEEKKVLEDVEDGAQIEGGIKAERKRSRMKRRKVMAERKVAVRR